MSENNGKTAIASSGKAFEDAVTAVRALLGVNAEVATDIVMTVKPHLEHPFHVAMRDLNAQIAKN